MVFAVCETPCLFVKYDCELNLANFRRWYMRWVWVSLLCTSHDHIESGKWKNVIINTNLIQLILQVDKIKTSVNLKQK
jgi:hypothetical protein